jgi:hypothetical protein
MPDSSISTRIDAASPGLDTSLNAFSTPPINPTAFKVPGLKVFRLK